jgi:hypothetical protein
MSVVASASVVSFGLLPGRLSTLTTSGAAKLPCRYRLVFLFLANKYNSNN